MNFLQRLFMPGPPAQPDQTVLHGMGGMPPAQDGSYTGVGAHSREVTITLGQPEVALPPVWYQYWPNYIHHLTRLYSPGIGAQAALTSYGYPYTFDGLRMQPPKIPIARMMNRGTVASTSRPGMWMGTEQIRIPSSFVPTNFTRAFGAAENWGNA